MPDPKFKLTLVNIETGAVILDHTAENVSWTFNNDLRDVPHSAYIGCKPIAKYSEGWNFSIQGYVNNENKAKDIEEAMKENGLAYDNR